MNIGVIGAGAIATFLLKEINLKQNDTLTIKSMLVRDKEKYSKLESQFGVKLYKDVNEFLDSGIDVVVETATVQAVKTLMPIIIKEKDVVLISIGALADEVFLTKVSELAEEHKHVIHLPSGAVGGLDLVQNAHTLGSITSVSLTTRKPANSLIEEVTDEERILFEGSASDAIKLFPKNINVSIVLSLAGIGIDKTTVTLIADPFVDKNIHHVEVKGDFGEASISITNNPLPENLKTSYLAAMSILGTLKRIGGRIQIGG